MSRPICGLTTTAERAVELVGTVEAHGMVAVLLPCIEVVPAPTATLEMARATADRVDWLVFSSPRAVTTLWPDGGMPDVAVSVVGSGTADAVERAGGSVAIVGEAGAEALVDRLSAPMAGRKVLFPHGAAAEPSTLHRLEAVADVTAVAVYETRSVVPGPDPVDVALFASPSAVTGWASSRRLDEVVLAAIGETTAAALASLGHPPHVVSPRPEHHLLIQTVARYLSDRSPV